MSFFKKVFVSLLAVSVLSCTLISVAIYSVFKKNIEVEYLSRYTSYENIISNTFRQLELASDNKNKIAVLMLSEMEKRSGIPTSKMLDDLAMKLGVNGFYIINKNGRFLRSSDIPVELQHNSLFSYDPNYKNLIYGNLSFATTPIIPSYPYDIPAKLTMISNYNKTLILESSTHLEYIEKILHQVISADNNIKSIGLYAPTGYELGSISSKGVFHQGRRNANKKIFLGNVVVGDDLFISTKVLSNSQNCLECKNKGVSTDGKYYYVLTFQVSLSPLLNQISILKYQISVIFIFMLMISVVLSILISKKLVTRIKKINNAVSEIVNSKNLNLQVNIGGNDEISGLANTFNQVIDSLRTSQANLIESEKKAALLDLAANVAHDISSPLAALTILTSQDLPIPEQSRILLRNVINRIRDIANDLINKYRDLPKAVETTDGFSTQLLTAILYPVITEKRLQLRSRSQISVELETNSESYGLFAKVNSTEFKRMLSNLINNAIESIVDNGKIVIRITQDGKNICLTLSDNGKGVPPDILSSLGKRGVSYDKQSGSGLGLHHAKITMEKFEGSLQFHSEVNKGTQIILRFPIADAPFWFLPQLEIHPNTTLVIVDDDISIHQLWQERFKQINHYINLIFFASPDKFQEWMEICENINSNLYFFDLEYVGFSQTGLNLIEVNQLQAHSILVTSHFEEKEVRERCEKLRVKMIPKDLAAFIPIILDE